MFETRSAGDSLISVADRQAPSADQRAEDHRLGRQLEPAQDGPLAA